MKVIRKGLCAGWGLAFFHELHVLKTPVKEIDAYRREVPNGPNRRARSIRSRLWGGFLSHVTGDTSSSTGI